jgi:hypothetical protein
MARKLIPLQRNFIILPRLAGAFDQVAPAIRIAGDRHEAPAGCLQLLDIYNVPRRPRNSLKCSFHFLYTKNQLAGAPSTWRSWRNKPWCGSRIRSIRYTYSIPNFESYVKTYVHIAVRHRLLSPGEAANYVGQECRTQSLCQITTPV